MTDDMNYPYVLLHINGSWRGANRGIDGFQACDVAASVRLHDLLGLNQLLLV